jgi:crossover junction endodeoxyribonuclease RusA
MIITVSYPDKILNPNEKSHFHKKAPFKKAHRNEGYWQAQKHGVILPEQKHHVTLIFYPPDNKPRDLDNALASMKSAIDGIADGLGINDKYFRPITIDFGDADKKNPRVVISISETPT